MSAKRTTASYVKHLKNSVFLLYPFLWDYPPLGFWHQYSFQTRIKGGLWISRYLKILLRCQLQIRFLRPRRSPQWIKGSHQCLLSFLLIHRSHSGWHLHASHASRHPRSPSLRLSHPHYLCENDRFPAETLPSHHASAPSHGPAGPHVSVARRRRRRRQRAEFAFSGVGEAKRFVWGDKMRGRVATTAV